MQKKFSDRVPIVGVTWSGSTAEYKSFIERHGLTFPNIDDSSGELFAQLGVVGQPAWAMIDPSGQAQVMMGVLPEDKLAEQLELLSQS